MIAQHQSNYHYIEVWLDHIEDLEEPFVMELTEKFQDRLLLLFRRQKLEEPIMSEERRRKLLLSLNGTKSLIDFNITTQIKDVEFIKEQKLHIPLLLSYHNYEKTPDRKSLQEIIDLMAQYSPEIYKSATFCQTDEDALMLLDVLLQLKKEQKKYIILGMGDKGKITRIFGTLWGNQMIFAPATSAEQSDPGQLTKQQLENIFKTLSLRGTK